jgi:hypothetical protein
MKAVIAALALSVAAAGAVQAQTGQWPPSSVNDNFIRGVNLSTVRARGNVRAFDAVSVYRERRDFAGHSVDYMLMHFEIDCAANTVRTINLHGYLADGSSVFSSKLNGDPEPIVEGSMSDGEKDTVCDEPSSEVRYPSVQEFFRWGRASGIATWNG